VEQAYGTRRDLDSAVTRPRLPVDRLRFAREHMAGTPGLPRRRTPDVLRSQSQPRPHEHHTYIINLWGNTVQFFYRNILMAYAGCSTDGFYG
jgi:hypothetical protein